MQPDKKKIRLRVVAVVPAGIAVNLALGTLVHTLKLPVYLDAVGTIAVTLLAGLRAGMIVGVASFLIGGVTVNPVLPWFSGTQAVIAIYTYFVAKQGWLRTGRPSSAGDSGESSSASGSSREWLLLNLRPIVCGVGLGVVAGIVSAPVIVALFGGITGSGASLVVAFLLESGQTLFRSVLLSGLASEPLDKTIQLLLAIGLIRALPSQLRVAFGQADMLARNALYDKATLHE